MFLPEGTRLRASFGGKPYFAVVEGAQIKYGKHVISPSGFANLEGSGNRNAWQAVWLRFPGSEEWLLADVCRAARNAAIARMFGGDAREVAQSSGAASRERRDDGERTRRPRTSARSALGRPAPALIPTAPTAALANASAANVPKAARDADARNKKAARRGERRRRRAAKPAPAVS